MVKWALSALLALAACTPAEPVPPPSASIPHFIQIAQSCDGFVDMVDETNVETVIFSQLSVPEAIALIKEAGEPPQVSFDQVWVAMDNHEGHTSVGFFLDGCLMMQTDGMPLQHLLAVIGRVVV